MQYFRKQQIWKHLIATAAFFLLFINLPVPAFAEDFLFLSSEAAVLMDAGTGQVLYEKNAHEQMFPASITKVVTGMLALKSLEPNQMLTVSRDAVDAVPRSSSHIGLEPGTQMTADQALHALAMVSANDAANVLGEAVSGNLDAFAARMTEEAHAIGAVNTHFTNANGLPDDDHYTTAYDMALIVSEALKVPGFTDYFNTISFDDGEYSFRNPNRILSGQFFYDGVLMSKTGWTSAAQGTLVTAVHRDGTTLVAVVLKSPVLEQKYEDTCAMLNYGFSRYIRSELTGEAIAEKLDMGNYVPAIGQKFSCLLPSELGADGIDYTLAEGMNLKNSKSDMTAVIINASIDGTVLPNMGLVLVRKDLGADYPAAATFFMTETETESNAESSGFTQVQWAIIILVILLFLGIELYRKHRRERIHRKRRLEGRIRQMKKQSE